MASDQQTDNDIAEIRAAVRQLCDKFGEDYWLQMDRENGYPAEFVSELTSSGYQACLSRSNTAELVSVCLKRLL